MAVIAVADRRRAAVLAAEVQQPQVRVDRAEQPLHARVADAGDVEPGVARRRGGRLADRMDRKPAQRLQARSPP